MQAYSYFLLKFYMYI